MLFLTFRLGQDRYALDAGQIEAILPLVAIKQLPGAPAGVAGAIGYRGRPVPLIDLSLLALGRPAEPLLSTRIILLRYPVAAEERRLLGLLAERPSRPSSAIQAISSPPAWRPACHLISGRSRPTRTA